MEARATASRGFYYKSCRRALTGLQHALNYQLKLDISKNSPFGVHRGIFFPRVKRKVDLIPLSC